MPLHFSKHYTREEARALLPQIRIWLRQLTDNRTELNAFEVKMAEPLATGADLGGEWVNRWIRLLVATREILQEFQSREIEIKDLDRGLIDFPAFLGDREVLLCWEKDEEDIEYWHDLASGYAGRERIE
jgi:hypothetical protein